MYYSYTVSSVYPNQASPFRLGELKADYRYRVPTPKQPSGPTNTEMQLFFTNRLISNQILLFKFL